MYILENNGVPSGCVAIAHVDEATAQLRFFFLEPEMRGRGAGHTLLDMAIEFCKEKRYGQVFLWTFSTLMAARHLYARKGFRITETRENNDWGEPILEECWNLDLSSSKSKLVPRRQLLMEKQLSAGDMPKKNGLEISA